MVMLPGPPGLSARAQFSGSPSQEPVLPSERQEGQSLLDESLGQVLSRTNPTSQQQRRLFEAARSTEPQLYAVTSRRPASPVLQDAYDALNTFYGGEAFDYLEAVNTILNNTFLPRDDQAATILDRLIGQRFIVPLEEV